MSTLHEVAARMVAPGRGILAADESIRTMSSRLEAAGVAASETTRRDYREMLVSTPDLATGVSGVILADETLRQSTRAGQPIPKLLDDLGILPGIKVDTGAHPLAGADGETITEGLDGLRARLAEYAQMGAAFAKWRAVITITGNTPSRRAIAANAHALARYARLCQEQGIVPIVEPEVMMSGAHTLTRTALVTNAVLREVFGQLELAGVDYAGMVLKPNMVVPGVDSPRPAGPEEVAEATVQTLLCRVPEQVAGVAFLSGGQAPAVATANLAAMQSATTPWPLTFSFGRALVDPALKARRGSDDAWTAGQEALAARVRRNVEALNGSYLPEAA
ncbi:MAG: fructose-bisphosphate aldolase class I [Kineosporiaceae bacterium]